jgi:hypothetical protein
MNECLGRERCSWWTLLGEIKEAFEMNLSTKRGFAVAKGHRGIVISLFSQAAHKVCKEHWEGKR